MRLRILFISLLSVFVSVNETNSQTTERPRPAEWSKLVYGGRFMDRFLPVPDMGVLTRDTWGADNVLPRYTDNGIEDRKWSYWGGNIQLGEDGKYHLYVCGWLENSPKGHAAWPVSTVFRAVSENSIGPFVVKDTIGKGHNPEVFKLSDGRNVLYVINGYYLADGCNGPWKYGRFEFLKRDRRLIEGNSNFTFARREDGSYLMICRGGGQWFSQTGLSAYNQVTPTWLNSEKKIVPLRAYPQRPGNFEDPVVWRDNVQYNLIVNDWLGRIAVYLRSKDGVKWKVESGEAYMPGIVKHSDGTVEGWFKLERMKIFQDQNGRAIQANFAVIDVEKKFDQGSDIHSSKNIGIPLAIGRLLTIQDKNPINAATKTIRVKIDAEPGFNPLTDIDIQSLRFGDPEEVNYGRGCTVLSSKKSGKDLLVTFAGSGNGIMEDEFAAKLLGKTSDGKLLFGYARLPGINFIEPILSALLPEIIQTEKGFNLKTEVQNFGQVASGPAKLKIVCTWEDKNIEVASGRIPGLKPFEMTKVDLSCGKLFEKDTEYIFEVIINPEDKSAARLHGKITPLKQ